MRDTSIGELLQSGRKQLQAAGSPEAGLEARLLLQHAGGWSSVQLLVNDGEPAEIGVIHEFQNLIARRIEGQPVHRIMGGREFYGRWFEISPSTLEPRPDTEILVETVLTVCKDEPGLNFLDIGTGSGAIAVSLLCEMPLARGVATDISAEALKMAGKNAKRHQVDERLKLLETDFSAGVEGEFDVIVSNPPYIREDEFAGLQREVRDHDPKMALVSGPSGLEAFERILAEVAGDMLKPGGWIIFEVGLGQAGPVEALARQQGLVLAGRKKDLSAIDRVVILRKPPQMQPWII